MSQGYGFAVRAITSAQGTRQGNASSLRLCRHEAIAACEASVGPGQAIQFVIRMHIDASLQQDQLRCEMIENHGQRSGQSFQIEVLEKFAQRG